MRAALHAATVTLLVAGCLGPAWVEAAYAEAARAAEEVGLSQDGHAWTTALTGSLFDEGRRWVPGDVETHGFLVRNQGPSGARLTVTVTSGDTGRLLAADDIELAARAGGGRWIPLANGTPSEQLAQATLPSGGTTRIDLRASFDTASVNDSQRKQLGLRFAVTLTEAAPGMTGGTPGNLPRTGATLAPWTTWASIALIGTGLLLAGRRRKEHDSA